MMKKNDRQKKNGAAKEPESKLRLDPASLERSLLRVRSSVRAGISGRAGNGPVDNADINER